MTGYDFVAFYLIGGCLVTGAAYWLAIRRGENSDRLFEVSAFVFAAWPVLGILLLAVELAHRKKTETPNSSQSGDSSL